MSPCCRGDGEAHGEDGRGDEGARGGEPTRIYVGHRQPGAKEGPGRPVGGGDDVGALGAYEGAGAGRSEGTRERGASVEIHIGRRQ
jgi:hypothetical protein